MDQAVNCARRTGESQLCPFTFHCEPATLTLCNTATCGSIGRARKGRAQTLKWNEQKTGERLLVFEYNSFLSKFPAEPRNIVSTKKWYPTHANVSLKARS